MQTLVYWTGTLALSLCFHSLYAQPAASPAGYVISEAGCASGGDSFAFCADKTVVVTTSGSDNPIDIKTGTWSQRGSTITMRLNTAYYAEGQGAPTMMGNNYFYDKYKAVKTTIDETKTYEWTDDTAGGCTEVYKQDVTCDPISHLRTKDPGLYPFTKSRLVTESELQKYSKDELRIMRNEIFARYDYAFQTKDMQAKFGKGGLLSDVNAFLTDTEQKNIDLIKKVEATKK